MLWFLAEVPENDILNLGRVHRYYTLIRSLAEVPESDILNLGRVHRYYTLIRSFAEIPESDTLNFGKVYRYYTLILGWSLKEWQFEPFLVECTDTTLWSEVEVFLKIIWLFLTETLLQLNTNISAAVTGYLNACVFQWCQTQIKATFLSLL